jgi:hypothetical protein
MPVPPSCLAIAFGDGGSLGDGGWGLGGWNPPATRLGGMSWVSFIRSRKAMDCLETLKLDPRKADHEHVHNRECQEFRRVCMCVPIELIDKKHRERDNCCRVGPAVLKQASRHQSDLDHAVPQQVRGCEHGDAPCEMVCAVEEVGGDPVSGVFAQLVLSEDLYNGVNTVWRDEEEQHAADYFEYAINTFADDAEIEKYMNDLGLPLRIHCRFSCRTTLEVCRTALLRLYQ